VPTQYDNALHLMEVQGGSFVKALANCYMHADTANKAKLRAAFADYFESYELCFRQHVANVQPSTQDTKCCSSCLRTDCNGECMGDGLMGG